MCKAFSARTGDNNYVYVKEPALLRILAQRMIDALAPRGERASSACWSFSFHPGLFEAFQFRLDAACKEMMDGLPIAAEFRHGSWLTAEKSFEHL